MSLDLNFKLYLSNKNTTLKHVSGFFDVSSDKLCYDLEVVVCSFIFYFSSVMEVVT